jgi:tetratricopeptide (TPR) repeat protein
MLPGERVELHAAYGEALSKDPGLAGPDGEAALPATLAYHWYAALDLPRALSSAIDAAARATASYAADEALRHLERALEIWPRVPDAEQRTRLDRAEVAGLAGDAALRTGAAERSKSLLASATAMLPATTDPVRKALLLQRYAITQRYLGEPRDAIATLRQALALLPTGETTRAHAVVLAALATAQSDINDTAGSAETARQAVADLREVRRAMGDRAGLQFTQPTRYISALVSLGRGDVAAARSAIAPGLASDHLLWAGRGWPVAWVAMRAEAEEAVMFRASREVIPERILERCDEIRRAAAAMKTPAPRFRAYQALVAAEHARATGGQVSQNDQNHQARPTTAADAWRQAAI